MVAAAAVVEVAVVPCFSAQDVKNAMPIRAVIKNKTDFFIVIFTFGGSGMVACKSDGK